MEIYYNLTGKKRKDFVDAISQLTGEKSKYLKVPSTAYQVGDLRIDKDGTLSWPDLNDADPSWREKREKLIEQLEEHGFHAHYPGDEEEEEEMTEFSISVPKENVNEENLKQLLEAKGKLIKKALGIKELTFKTRKETVEFPWFENIEPEELATYTKFIAALCKMSVTQKRINKKETTFENERYTFRCFLLRLGFIGDEYKDDRKILLSRLTGSSAFKNGRKKDGGDNENC